MQSFRKMRLLPDDQDIKSATQESVLGLNFMIGIQTKNLYSFISKTKKPFNPTFLTQANALT